MVLNDTPEMRRKAYTTFETAKIARQKPTCCQRCGRKQHDIHAHHDDYARPLDVQWLCRSCHIKHHIALRKAAGTYKPGGRKGFTKGDHRFSDWIATFAAASSPKTLPKKRRAA